MEFLKTCDTNAQAIGDFEAIEYQSFSLKRDPAHTATRTDDRKTLDDLRAAEAELRQQQRFVIQDASRPWLWLFRATTVDQIGQKPQDLPPLDGYELHSEHTGIMKAAEMMAQPPQRLANRPSTSNINSTNVPAKAPQAGSSRPTDQQSFDIWAIYELFTSSIVALISYSLVKDHNAIALNYRTFVSKPPVLQDFERGGAGSVDAPLQLSDISVYWASSGTLVVYTNSIIRPEIRCLEDVASHDMQKRFFGRCIRIAPHGAVAMVVGFDDVDAPTEDTSHRLHRKRTKLNSTEQSVARWKSTTIRWLRWKGYSIAGLENNTAWTRIRIAPTTAVVASSPSPNILNMWRDILWPTALCFYYEDDQGSATDILPNQVTALDWFETSQSSGFRDPIDVAQQWFLGKPERDRAIEARRRAQKAEEDAARSKDELPGGLFPSSPLNSRSGVYGELQAVSGVYPTPPDGVVPGAVTSGDTPSVSGAAANTVLVPGGSNPAINLSAPQDNMHTDESLQPATSPDFSMSFDHFNASGGNDDLFEDMDEDTYEGNGVTEDDFNFFDEPDGEDVDMLDAPRIQDIKPSPKKGTKDKTPRSTTPNPVVKEENSDPMAALEDALTTASNPLDTKPAPKSTNVVTEPTPTGSSSRFDKHSNAEEKAKMLMHRGPTPPLSPRHIQERILPSPNDRPNFQSVSVDEPIEQRDSAFDPVVFSQKMKLSDAKYVDGRFDPVHGKAVPFDQTSKAKDSSKRITSLKDVPLLTKLRYAIGVAATRGIPEIASMGRADDDFSDESSDSSSIADEEEEDHVSIPPEPLSATFTIGGKRKLPTDGNATPLSTISFADSFGGELADIGLQTDEGYLSSLEPSPWDWSLLSLPGPTEAPSATARFSIPKFSPIVSSLPNTPTSQPEMTLDNLDEKPLSRSDCIAVAQVVTDQIASSTFDILQGSDESEFPGFCPTLTPVSPYAHDAIKNIFHKATDCTMSSLIAIHDVFPENFPQPKGPQRPAPRRQNETATPGHLIYQINAPCVRIRRADTLWDLLPPALTFWETLGLSPCSSPKNVVSFCMYPNSESLRPCLENFSLNMQLAYEGCKLGTHGRGDIADFEGGLVPYNINNPPSLRGALKALRDTCFGLGKMLSVKHTQMREKDDNKVTAFVIYMVDIYESPSSVWELCSAFWSLFQAYGQGPPARPDHVPKPDVVLKIVPMKYIASFDTPVILSTSTYINLAREIFDRCPPSAPSGDKTSLSIFSAPSFQLEESIPRGIPFSLNAEPPQDLLRENSYMHLGYAISLDGAWITAAWTDRSGKSQAIVSYNLGTRLFGEIAKEMWTTTIEILQARRVTWRLCIAKVGVMEKEEMDAWKFMASCPTHFNLFTTLLTVDVNPTLKIQPNMLPLSSQLATSANPASNTPGSTPQAGLSPDPHSLTPAATPSADNAADPSNDLDARLVDVTDETWGVILAHRLHNSNSTVEFRPVLISGLLVKRGSPPNPPPYVPFEPVAPSFDLAQPTEAGPITIGVNILWVGAVNPTNPNRAPGPQSPFPVNSDGSSPSPSPVQERPTSSLMWTPTAQMRATAENLIKEVMAQYRGLGTLARMKGLQGTRGGAVPWHVAVAKQGVEGLTRCLSSMS